MQYNTAFALCKLCLPNLARDKLSDHDSKNCSDVRAVTWFRICPGLAENCRKWLEIGASRGSKSTSAFCKICLSNLAKDESSNHNSENCSEISAVTWFGIFFRFLKIATFIFFTPPYCTLSTYWGRGRRITTIVTNVTDTALIMLIGRGKMNFPRVEIWIKIF